MSAILDIYREEPIGATPEAELRELSIINTGGLDGGGAPHADPVINTTFTVPLGNGFLVSDIYYLTIWHAGVGTGWQCTIVRSNWDQNEEGDANVTKDIEANNGVDNDNTIIEGIRLRTHVGLDETYTYTATIYCGNFDNIIEDGEESTPSQFWCRNNGISTATNCKIKIVSDAHPVNKYSESSGGPDDPDANNLVFAIREARYTVGVEELNPVTANYLVKIVGYDAGPPKTYDIEIYLLPGMVLIFDETVEADCATEYNFTDGLFIVFTDECDDGDVDETLTLIKVSDGKDYVLTCIDYGAATPDWSIDDKPLTCEDDGCANPVCGEGIIKADDYATWWEKVAVDEGETPEGNARKSLVLVCGDTI